MKTPALIPALLVLAGATAQAYPPAPFHRIYGKVRDDHGNPFGTGDGIVILYGSGDKEIVRGPTDPGIDTGINYSLSVPMDAGTTSSLYTVNALRPTYPFTLRVVRGSTSYLPLQMSGATWNIGDPAGSTRIDLTLGVDSDGDGLPDAWEYELIRTDPSGRLRTLADVKPDADSDGDGLSNRMEYIAGTYATDASDGLFLEVVSVSNGIARLRFLAIKDRSYKLRSSTDVKNFGEQPFSLKADASNPFSGWTAPDTTIVDIFVSTGSAPSKMFRLYAD